MRFAQWHCTRNSVKERDPIVHGRMKWLNTSPKASKLNPSCSGHAHSNRLGTGHEYESDVYCALRKDTS